MTVEQNNDRIAQCVSMLRDDYERQSGYLNFDDVSRIMSRRNLAPEEVSAVWIGLDQIGIVVDGLNVPKEVVAIAPPPTEDNVSFPNDMSF